MDVKNFAVINGECDCDCENGILHYKGIKLTEENYNNSSITVVRSNERFSSGKVSFSVKASGTNSSFMFSLKTIDDHDVLIGFNRIRKCYLIATDDGKLIISGGSLLNTSIEDTYLLQISVIGSRLQLYVNTILICEANITLKEQPIEFHFLGSDEVYIENVSIEKQLRTVFVVMQFTQEYNDLYNQVIIPVIEKYNLKCVRADDIYTATPILSDIINEIKSASIIIADITPDNPNVFYELGFAHALNKPTIVLSEKKREKLPFDVSGLRTIFYDNTIAGKTKIEQNLEKFIEKIIHS